MLMDGIKTHALFPDRKGTVRWPSDPGSVVLSERPTDRRRYGRRPRVGEMASQSAECTVSRSSDVSQGLLSQA